MLRMSLFENFRNNMCRNLQNCCCTFAKNHFIVIHTISKICSICQEQYPLLLSSGTCSARPIWSIACRRSKVEAAISRGVGVADPDLENCFGGLESACSRSAQGTEKLRFLPRWADKILRRKSDESQACAEVEFKKRAVLGSLNCAKTATVGPWPRGRLANLLANHQRRTGRDKFGSWREPHVFRSAAMHFRKRCHPEGESVKADQKEK